MSLFVSKFAAMEESLTELVALMRRIVFPEYLGQDDRMEIVLCYPCIKMMLRYRTAHELQQLEVPVAPRLLTEMAHSATGIDIHPGAKIGEYFAIDHDTVVGGNVWLTHDVPPRSRILQSSAVEQPLFTDGAGI